MLNIVCIKKSHILTLSCLEFKTWRRGGLMVIVLNARFKHSRFKPLSGTLCWVLGQDTLLSQCLSLPRCIGKVR